MARAVSMAAATTYQLATASLLLETRRQFEARRQITHTSPHARGQAAPFTTTHTGRKPATSGTASHHALHAAHHFHHAGGRREFLHHLFHLAVLLEHTVHILNLAAGTVGDTALARAVNEIGFAAFGWRHGQNDGFHFLDFTLGSTASHGLLNRRGIHAGQFVEQT